MKKITLLLCIFFSYKVIAQDTTATKKGSTIDSTQQHKKLIYHEVGVNATYVVTNIFNTSSNISIQPYQLTYKLIKNRWAIRAALGINTTHSTSETYSSNQNGSTQDPPDSYIPNYSNSLKQYARLGGEYRFRVSKNVLVYTGFDVVEQIINSSAQSMYMNNNLPVSYDYSRTNSHSNSSGLGMGPVIGIQLLCTKRISIYTEIPFYYVSTRGYSQITSYKNTLNQSTGWFVSNTTYQTQFVSSTAFSITIPATIYLAVKF